MTRRIDGIPVVYRESEQQCDLCGTIAELRPYGPNGEMICYECGQQDRAATERAMHRHLFGEEQPTPATPKPR